MKPQVGQFVWYEFLSTDVEASMAYYTEVMGWKTMPFEESDKPYTMFCVGDQPIGGVSELPEEVKAQNIPSHWMASVMVDDVDKTVSRAKELGGQIHLPAFDIKNVGRYSVIGDKEGAALGLFKPQNEMTLLPKNTQGVVGWKELNTTDNVSAMTFYQELFGWHKTEAMDMGEMGKYEMFGLKGVEGSLGGMSNAAKKMNFPPSWVYYVNVSDIDAAAKRATSKGGTIHMGPMEVPGGAKIVMCMDPQG